MKLGEQPGVERVDAVAPRAGAWIETAVKVDRTLASTVSPPARGRGLKHVAQRRHPGGGRVAPRAGAWIETIPP